MDGDHSTYLDEIKALDQQISKADNYLLIAERQSEKLLDEMRYCLHSLKKHKDKTKLLAVIKVFEKAINVLSGNSKRNKNIENLNIQGLHQRAISSDAPNSEMFREKIKFRKRVTVSMKKANFMYGQKKKKATDLLNLYKTQMSSEEQQRIEALIRSAPPQNVFSLSEIELNKMRELDLAIQHSHSQDVIAPNAGECGTAAATLQDEMAQNADEDELDFTPWAADEEERPL